MHINYTPTQSLVGAWLPGNNHELGAIGAPKRVHLLTAAGPVPCLCLTDICPRIRNVEL